MRRTVLNGTVLDKPRGITVHPLRGYMFYTDWSSEKACVCRANLDGSAQVLNDITYNHWRNVHEQLFFFFIYLFFPLYFSL